MKKIISKESLVRYKKFIIGGVILFLITYYLVIANNFLPYSLAGNRVKNVSVAGHGFRVEVVDGGRRLSKGLAERRNMCENCGMVFEFNRDEGHGMWMKGMMFDLDILWIRDGEVVWMEKSVSKNDALTVYGSNVTSDTVLELNAGTIDKYEFKRGDRVVVE